MANIKQDLTGMTFGKDNCILVIGYAGKGKWTCTDNKGNTKDIYTTHLTGGYVKTLDSKACNNKFIDLTGKTFGKLIVINYAGNSKWNCECQCENHTKTVVRGYELRKGLITRCDKCKINSRRDDLTGQTINNWEVLSYSGNKRYRCRCKLCNRTYDVFRKNLLNGKSKSCVECSNKLKLKDDLTGEKFGSLTVKNYMGNREWLCECSCGNTIISTTYRLKENITRCCRECYVSPNLQDLSNQVIGSWEVIDYAGKYKWNCTCLKCGETKQVLGYNLRKGYSLSCNCDSLIDLTGQQINEWTVLEYIGNSYWKCRCSCGTEKQVHSHELRTNGSQSCGCKKWLITKKKMMSRYQEIAPSKFKNKRTKEQLDALESKDELKKFIDNNFDCIPNTYQLGKKLGLESSYTLKNVHRLDADDLVDINSSVSRQEVQLRELIETLVQDEYKIIYSDRKVLNRKELDIYIPDKQLAIEFNGTYWHSDIFKDKMYHYNKTIECSNKGIRLIHIFEYEWQDILLRDKIEGLLKRILVSNNKVYYARNTRVGLVDSSEIRKFLDLYHLQGAVNSEINIGCFSDTNEILGVMTFGTPRFNSNYDYELHRLCWKDGVNVVGGSEKLFNYFINNYKPASIISYCNIAKFTGDIYNKLGFSLDKVSEPNYVWVSGDNDVLSRYKTQKHKLIAQGLGNLGNTENEIMEALDYFKVYDCGNAVYTWNNKEV